MSFAGSYSQDWKFATNLLNDLKISHKVKRRNHSKTNTKNRNSIVLCSKREDIVKFGEFIYKGVQFDGIGFRRKFERYMIAKHGGL